MKILAAPHPFLTDSPTISAPPSLNSAFSAPEAGLPRDVWHIGFSRSGDLLYRSDNLPPVFRTLPTLKGIDLFFSELNLLVHTSSAKDMGPFRSQCFVETRVSAVFKVFRKDLTLPPRLGIASRKTENLLHFLFVPEGSASEADSVLQPAFFSGGEPLLQKTSEWLEHVDDESLSIVALGIFKAAMRNCSRPDVVIRSVRGTILYRPNTRQEDQLPMMPGEIATMPRWWGTRIGGEDSTGNVWAHTVLRCARGLPVMTVSANTEFIRKIGISFFRGVLIRMSEQILECSKVFSWGSKYRYARQWLNPAGYDLHQADRILRMIRSETETVALIPVHTNLANLREIALKTRMDEPFFWDLKEEQAWITIRDLTAEEAEMNVRPSLVSRLEKLVGSPVSAEIFLLRHCESTSKRADLHPLEEPST
ncbi:MAG: hypothetical protein ACYDAM_01150 [Leptospirales bacterium]